MSQNSGKRERYLRKQRDRAARKAGTKTAPADMRFGCRTCGHEFAIPGNVMVAGAMLTNASTGEQIPIQGTWQAVCPRCGQTAQAVNAVDITQGQSTITGFADTPDQVQEIVQAMQELQDLRADASLDEIVAVLEEQGPHLRAVGKYLKEHHLELIGLGVDLLALVIAVLVWLLPADAEERPQPPDGITHEQMEKLIAELGETSRRQEREKQAERRDSDGKDADSKVIP